MGFLGGATVWPLAPARAQQPTGRVRRIGLLLSSAVTDPQAQRNVAAFTKAIEELGWKDNIRIDIRWAEAQSAAALASARELVDLASEVIVVAGGGTTTAVGDQVRTTPIVFVGFTDPVAGGFVESLARPGRNMTGFTSIEFSVGGKWLEILKGVAPGIARMTAIYNPETAPYGAQFLRWNKSVASSLDIDLAAAPIRDEAGIKAALAALGREPGGGLMVLPDAFNSIHRHLIVALAAERGVPAIYPGRAYPMAGGLISYGVELPYLFRQAASYVDRILRGARAGELPVQTPTKFELVINLKAAKSLGVDIPSALLATADEVIE
jgi:putative tryptophan/tyrosine transport system substrate-binding protein